MLIIKFITMKNIQSFINFKEDIKSSIKVFLSKYYSIFSKPTLFIFFIFFLALLPLFRANVNYIDDSERALNGGRDWAYLHSRWTSEYLSVFIHADSKLRDIAPLTQILAILLISLSSVILCWVISEKKLTRLGVLLAAFLGLSPFFLECFAFKFDSPYMALSILASIFPFLFAFKNKMLFFATSFLGLLIMLTTYQLSSGVYIMIVIFLLFNYWNNKSLSVREMIDFIFVSVVSYFSALVVFRIFFLQTKIFSYNNFFSINKMPLGIIGNIKDNFEEIINNFNYTWVYILALMIILFVTKSMIISKQNKILSLILASATLSLMFIFFQGFFIFVDKVGSVPRYFVGVNAFIAIVALFLARPPFRFFATPAVVLLYCFFIFSFMFGNALEYQKNYKTFFATMLIGDLSKIIVEDHRDNENSNIYFMDSIGNAPGVKSLQKDYPIIKHLIPNDFGKHVFGYTNLRWYNFPAIQPQESPKKDKEFLGALPVLVNSYYYTIRGDENKNLYIWFNNR